VSHVKPKHHTKHGAPAAEAQTKVALAAKEAPQAPVVPPAPPPPPAPAAPAANPDASGHLTASAKLSGFKPVRRLTLFNNDKFDWKKCELRLTDNRRYLLPELTAHDSEAINLMRFVQDGVVYDVDVKSVTVHCAQGSAKVDL
jgi:hypothetical protein